MMGLTEKQATLLAFIQSEYESGRSPTFDEMREAVGLKSKSGVHRLVTSLEERGHIARMKGRWQSIVPLIQKPSGVYAQAIDAARESLVDGGSAQDVFLAFVQAGKSA